MPVTVIIGGQFGSEGKGKIAKYFAEEQNADIVIRCGGSNSGHTIIDESGTPLVFRQLPTACVNPEIISVLCAGMYIDTKVLFNEIKMASIKDKKLLIDNNAVIITDDILNSESQNSSLKDISSTLSGTGEAVKKRVERTKDLVFAKDIEELKPYLCDTKHFLREQLNLDKRIILEGTQGYGLSLLHSDFYPYVTSRDTTAAGFVSEAGLSPLDVDDIVLVIRTFPIRVHGNSGPLANEIDWQTVSDESGDIENIIEYTSVTKKIRRVARFDAEIVKKAIEVNNPTKIVLNHVDYLKDFKNENIKTICLLFEKEIGKTIGYAGISRNETIKVCTEIKY